MHWVRNNLDIDGPPILCRICNRLLNNPDTGDDEYFFLDGISDEQYRQIIEIWEVDPYGGGFPICIDCIHGHRGVDLLSLRANQWLEDHWQEYKENLGQLDSTPSQ